jgi:sec-independent protein translocase protein TatB
MSGIGFFELVILFMIGLVVLGPQRLPKVANQLGTWIGQARRMTRVMKRQLEDELDLDDNFKSLKNLGDELKDDLKDDLAIGDDLTIGPAAAHVPRDDDSYSPLHDAGPAPTVAGMRVDEDVEPADSEAAPDDEGAAEEPAQEKPA